MGDDFETLSPGLNAPATNAVEIDISVDDAALACCSRAVFVGTGGDIKAQMRGGAIVTFRNVVGGCERPWQVRKIFKDGTTARDLVALW